MKCPVALQCAHLCVPFFSLQLDVLQACIDSGSLDIVHETTEAGATALHVASFEGYSDCVQVLLAAGASVSSMMSDNCATALHLACLGGSLECVKLLLGANATADSTLSNGCTALYTAAWKGHAIPVWSI